MARRARLAFDTRLRAAPLAEMWPGITRGMDSRCTCTLAPLRGRYQVKFRHAACLNHGGDLAAVMARMARWTGAL